MTTYELFSNKETPNKFRWTADVDGVAFKLYIPQQFVPRPLPDRIVVCIDTDAEEAAIRQANIKSVVDYVEDKTETVRYAPTGHPETWRIGEPYIPMTELPQPRPKRVYIAVSWGQS